MTTWIMDSDNWLEGAEQFPVMVYASTSDSLSRWFDITPAFFITTIITIITIITTLTIITIITIIVIITIIITIIIIILLP